MRDPRTKRTSAPRGFSLIEVMIAMVVMSVGMIGLVGMLNVAAKRDGDGRRKDRATAIAYDLLHHLQKVPVRLPDDSLNPILVDPNTSNGTDMLNDAGTLGGTGPADLCATGKVDFCESHLTNIDPTTQGIADAAGADLNFLGYLRAEDNSACDPTLPTPPPDGRPTLDFNNDCKSDFNRHWIIDDEFDSKNPGLVKGKKIAVVVTWTDPALNIRKLVTVVGYRANRRLTLPGN